MTSNSEHGEERAAAAFAVNASACTHTLCRILGYVAQQDLTVDAMQVARTGDAMRLSMRIATIDLHRARILAAKMRMIVTVEAVALSWRGEPDEVASGRE